MLTLEQVNKLIKYESESVTFHRIPSGREVKKTKRYKPHSDKTYYVIAILGKQYYIHRIVWLLEMGEYPKSPIDHIDGDTSNNHISNLREVTNSVNLKNAKRYKASNTAICGVTWSNAKNHWHAYISLNKKRVNLYRGRDLFEACCRRISAQNKDPEYTRCHGK